VAGADDWLPLPYRSDVFRARLWTAHRMIELQRALADTQQSLAREGERDSVTGHLKHRVMLEVLERELIRAQRAGVPVGVAIAEVDAFVAVTETFGRSIGHAVLHEAGRRLRDAVRRYDTVGRYRNHAFLAVLPGCDAVKIRLVAERLRTDIAASPMRIADLSLPVTLSIGIASSDRGAESPTASRLLEDAEAALDVAQVRGCTRIDIVPHTA
jgi:diguanylate cyclase (GGDEF)-like protein